MSHEPPATITLRFCPECGRMDRYLRSELAGHYVRTGKPLCFGTVQTLTYTLDTEGEKPSTREPCKRCGGTGERRDRYPSGELSNHIFSCSACSTPATEDKR
jgi:hypothetical protein